MEAVLGLGFEGGRAGEGGFAELCDDGVGCLVDRLVRVARLVIEETCFSGGFGELS